MRFPLLIGFLSLLAVSATCEAQTIFLVRHAERADAGGPAQEDPGLSAIGRARANALAATLRGAGIGSIYVTEFRRTQETAEPLAKKLGITPIVTEAKQTAELASKLKSAKKRVLVVGHSNTLPEILHALGITSPPVIGENEYDDILVFEREPSPHVLQLHTSSCH